MKTKLEIIQETYDYYTPDPNGRRALDSGGQCRYLLPDGRKCAVGRCLDPSLDPEKIMQILAGNAAGAVLDSKSRELKGGLISGQHLLAEEYRGHSREFWACLQTFHDWKVYWDEENNKITEQGQEAFKRLKEKYGNTISE